MLQITLGYLLVVYVSPYVFVQYQLIILIDLLQMSYIAQ